MRERKRGQLEIMGLAIIVVLLSFGMLLVFRFVVFKSPDTTKQDISESQQATNILKAILKTSTGCKRTDMTELFQDCGSSIQAIYCDVSDIRYRNIFPTKPGYLVSSCKFLEASMPFILNETFDKWNQLYSFKAYTNDIDKPLMHFANNLCKGEKQSEEFPIPTSSGQTMFIKFDICR